MLILSRKRFESITCELNGVQIKFTVNEVRGDRVKVAVDAPSHVKILRTELRPEGKESAD